MVGELGSVQIVARAMVASILLVAGIAKGVQFASFKQSLEQYAIVPKQLRGLVAGLVTGSEIGLGSCLALAIWDTAAAFAAAGLFAVFGAALSGTMHSGTSAKKCGCVPGLESLGVTWFAVARALALAALSLLYAVWSLVPVRIASAGVITLAALVVLLIVRDWSAARTVAA